MHKSQGGSWADAAGRPPSTHLHDLRLALIQARVVNLGALVHTVYECGYWHAYDWRTYDGGTVLGTSAFSETEAVVELLDKLEERA